MIKLFQLFFIALNTVCVLAQTTVITGGTIHIGNGTVINNGALVIELGKILRVENKLGIVPKNATFIDATGKHLYPGLILLNTTLGLNEIDAVRATRDFNETGEINPNVRAIVAYNTDSKVTPTALYNGVTHMQVVPAGGLISGKSCVVKTQAFNWEDAAVLQEDGVHINWPEINIYAKNKAEQIEKKQDEINLINQTFFEAKAYLESADYINLKYKSLQPVLLGKQQVYIHATTSQSIKEAIDFFVLHQIRQPVLVSNHLSVSYIPALVANRISVILNLVHSLPQFGHSDVDAPYKAVATLLNNGVNVAVGMSGSWESRNVMFTAGTCATYGITKEQALQTITLNAAKVLGFDSQMGTLEVGKNAHILIANGDILDMKSNQLDKIFIDGLEVDLTNHQTELYNKYQKHYWPK